MAINIMQGTSAYLEYIGPKGKKHRKNCYNNNDGVCSNKRFKGFGCKCVGRFVCDDYKELELEYEEVSYFQCLYYKKLKYFNEKSDLYLLECCKKDNCSDIVGRKKKYVHSNNLKERKSIALKRELNNLINKKYLLEDLQSGEVFKVIFVSEDEKDELSDKFSVNSPLAKVIALANNIIIILEMNKIILKYKIVSVN